MRRKRKWKEGGTATGINPVPVLSVVFILLLFFIAVAPFARERGLDLGLWGHHNCDVPIVFVVDNRNRIFVEEGSEPGQVQHRWRQVDVRSVKDIVARKLAETPVCGVSIQAHRNSDMGIVVRVMDEAKLARDRPPVPVSVAVVD